MPLKRKDVLIAVVLMLASQTYRASADERNELVLSPVAPEAAADSISGASVKPDGDAGWLLEFDYSYTGNSLGVVLRIELTPLAGTGTAPFNDPVKQFFGVRRGVQHAKAYLDYPGEGTSGQVIVTLTSFPPENKLLASQRIDQTIKWPSQDEKDLETARDLLDDGRQDAIRQARPILERLVVKNPKVDAVYVELARLAMRTSSGPEALHQAESLLGSALELRSDNPNAKILLGYVYAHQKRFEEAERQFVDAARSNPPNLWLWTNWGEALEMQGNVDGAITKYREATRPNAPRHSYRARESAYVHLLTLLEARNDADGMEAVHEARVAEFRWSNCYTADYARFKLTVRGDAQGAIDIARSSSLNNCDVAPSRQIIGLASYVKWARGSGTESVEALNQARVYLPVGSTTLYLLASSDSTMVAARKLIAAGEAIDQKDHEQMTALAHALRSGKLDAAERLLSVGARAETPVGPEAIPVALLPVLDDDVAAVRVLRHAGVDYSKVRFRGATALDIAKQIGDDALIKALTQRSRTL